MSEKIAANVELENESEPCMIVDETLDFVLSCVWFCIFIVLSFALAMGCDNLNKLIMLQ